MRVMDIAMDIKVDLFHNVKKRVMKAKINK